MAAYVVVDGMVTNLERFSVYMRHAEEAVRAFGGRFLVRGGRSEVLEGDWDPARVVVIEFPDVAAAKAWYSSEGYLNARTARADAAVLNMVLVEGVAPA